MGCLNKIKKNYFSKNFETRLEKFFFFKDYYNSLLIKIMFFFYKNPNKFFFQFPGIFNLNSFYCIEALHQVHHKTELKRTYVKKFI